MQNHVWSYFNNNNDNEEKSYKYKCDLTKYSNYRIMQLNGQRIFAPHPHLKVPTPPKGSEVFLGNLPPDCFEPEIVQLFGGIGAIFNVRIMIDFSGKNRGFGFVTYFCQKHAFDAIEQLDKYRIRSKTRLAVTLSIDNRRLFVGNIPRDKTRTEIAFALHPYMEGMTAIIMHQEIYNSNQNRGFVFVEFESHRDAALARRKLSFSNLILWDQQIFVDWAEPIPIIEPTILNQIKKLYLSNLPVNITPEELENFIYKLVPPQDIIKIHKTANYAFIHFTTKKIAEYAMDLLKGLKIRGQNIDVEWARPPEYSKKYRRMISPDNYCRNVPPQVRRMVCESIAQRKKKSGSCSSSI